MVPTNQMNIFMIICDTNIPNNDGDHIWLRYVELHQVIYLSS